MIGDDKSQHDRVSNRAPQWGQIIESTSYEVDPLTCSQCGGRMRIIAFITDYSVVDRITNYLKLRFIADKPPPPQAAYQEFLMAAEAGAEYFL